jgi:hypothetical protein
MTPDTRDVPVMAFSRPGSVRRRAAAIVAGVFLWTAAAASAPAQELIDRVLAVVSGTVITLSDARAAVELGFVDVRGARDPIAVALKWLIERQLVLDEATRYEPLEPDLVAVEAALVVVRRRFASDAAWSQALLRLGLTEESARTMIGEMLYAEAYVDQRLETLFQPSEAELRAYYDLHREAFVRDGRPRPFEDARADVETVLERERRTQSLIDWLARLRRRADVSELYVPVR